MRLLAHILCVTLVGCATTGASDAMRADCELDIESHEECLELLTSSGDGYESREEVMAAEEDRENQKFADRLRRLRQEEERRQAERARSSTVTTDLDPELAEAIAANHDDVDSPAGDAEVEALAELTDDQDGDDSSGSSIRAIKQMQPPKAPEKVSLVKQRETPAMLGSPITPEDYLRAARCLLQGDMTGLRATLSSEKKRARSRELGTLALAIVDAETLVGRVEGEMVHRRLAKRPNECRNSNKSATVAILRTLVGERPARALDAATYGRGLDRLSRELEVRAGIPKAE